MITPFTIYLITSLDKINIFLGTITSFLIAGIFASFIWLIIDLTPPWHSETAAEENKRINKAKQCKKYMRNFFIAAAVIGLLTSITPSTKSAILIYGIPAAINAAENNKQITQLPNNLLKFINTWLIKETEKETLKPTISQ